MPYFRDSTETYVKGYDATDVTVAGMTQHYWVFPAPTGQTAGELLHHDTRRNTFAYHASGGPYRIAYDSRDYYYQGTGAISHDTLLKRVTARVTPGDTLTADVTSHRSADTNTFTRTPQPPAP